MEDFIVDIFYVELNATRYIKKIAYYRKNLYYQERLIRV